LQRNDRIMGIVEQYLLQLNTEKRRWRRAAAIVTVLSLLVAVGVSWNLRMTGVTIANGAMCGQAEHTHTGECAFESVLTCGYPEYELAEEGVEFKETQISEETPASNESCITLEPAHVHTEDCYQIAYLCGYEEHIHSVSCYSDSTADIESAAIWEESLPKLTGQWAYDIVSVAKSQIDCTESERNYVLADDGQTKKGITRFGQWYGNPYGDWSGMFTLFCMHYASVSPDAIPRSPGVDNMMRFARDAEIFELPDESMGNVGNILFWDTDENNKPDHTVIVVSESDSDLIVIGGDIDNSVREIAISRNDSSILGYIDVAQAQINYIAGKTNDTAESTFEETTGIEETTDAEETTGIEETTDAEETTGIEETTDAEETTGIEETTDAEETTGIEETTDAEETTGIEETTDAEETTGIEETTDTGETTDTEETTETAETTETEEIEESGETVVTLLVEFPEEGIIRITAQADNIDLSMYYWQWQYSADGKDPWNDIEGDGSFVCELEDTDENFYRYYRVQGYRKIMMFAARAAVEDTGGDSSSPMSETLITSEVITPFSIGKNSNTYTVDVYALPVGSDGKRITDLAVIKLGTMTINSTAKQMADSLFNRTMGEYQSAYFGSENAVTVDNILSIWRYRSSGRTYYLAYAQTDGTQNQRWKSAADETVSLYLRYIPQHTVVFMSDGFDTVTEIVEHGQCPTVTEPGSWEREGYTLLGWNIRGDSNNVYTYEELMSRPVTDDMTYTAQWANFVTVSFNLGEYELELYPISPQKVTYGSSINPLPTPLWRNNSAYMAFDGWYLNEELTNPVTSSHVFLEDTIVYAKWSPIDDGYFIYFMDFEREGELPLVLMTYSVTEGRTTSPFVPANVPDGKQWDGKWYLDEGLTRVYDFAIPVSQMTDDLRGADKKDLYLYPGTQDVCRAIFVTYGTRIDPVTVVIGGVLDLDRHTPERYGYTFSGWRLEDGTPVSGEQRLYETTTFYAAWDSGYVDFEAVLRIENADDTAMTQASILGSWYAKAGSQIRVKSTYSGSGNNRTGTHRVVCVLDGVEYPVYTDSALTKEATLADTYNTYFIYNNSGTEWTDEVNWDDVYTGGELPYSTRPISSAGDTIINFDYMCVRNDIVFTIPNASAYIDVYKLYQEGIIDGSVTYTGTRPTAEGNNVSATGISSTNVRWSYTASTSSSTSNTYTLHDIKYNQHIYEVYPVGGTWLTTHGSAFHWYKSGGGDLFSSRRETASSDFFNGSGRKMTAYSMTAVFSAQDKIALMYAIECLDSESPDFTVGGIGYKVQTQLCEIVNHTGDFSQKELLGYETVASASYTRLSTTTSKIGDTSVKTLFGTTYWDYYKIYDGISSLSDIDKAYIFYYNRVYIGLQFSFAYDSNGDGSNDTADYDHVAYGENISEYRFGMPDMQEHPLLNREGYRFMGWLDANGNILLDSDWSSMVAAGVTDNSTMIFIAKWEKVSNNIVEYYEDRSADTFFETHYFEDGDIIPFPNMTVYPENWVWQQNGENTFKRFDWDVPMYGDYGTKETRVIGGKDIVVNVIRIYGTWDESHTRVVYDPNAPQGGVPGSAPIDTDEYTIWQSSVPVSPKGSTANADPDMIFGGWLLDRDGTVYQPGDHVPVRWPRTMIFTAQWTKPEAAVHLLYDPNGGLPTSCYPNNIGFAYRKDSSAYVWNNIRADSVAYFTRPGYSFTGWNTAPDGSGIAYQPGSRIVLSDPLTVLYAQWEKQIHTLSVYKVDSESKSSLTGAVFGLYREENGLYVHIQSLTTGVDGRISFQNLVVDTNYKLVEEKPPDGYAIITREIYFSLKPSQTTVSLEFRDSSGRVISSPSGVSGEYVSGNRHLTLYVENLRGYALPSTGGMGIHLHMLFGLLLTAAPFVYVLSLRRKSERGTG